MKTELKPGMKVRLGGYSSTCVYHEKTIAIITGFNANRLIIYFNYYNENGDLRKDSIHRRNIVSVFRKKKRKKHEIWVNEYANEGPFIKVCAYKSKRDADELASSDRIGPAKRYVLAKRQDA